MIVCNKQYEQGGGGGIIVATCDCDGVECITRERIERSGEGGGINGEFKYYSHQFICLIAWKHYRFTSILSNLI